MEVDSVADEALAANAVVELLCSNSKLDRDKGIVKLQSLCESNQKDVRNITDLFHQLLNGKELKYL